ncbi:hypothetical protein MKZ38_005342 [Zalerion maritima]|uniref:Ribonuclease P protein subunit n=1 Tax=Zalerion maritima TaxID=339359 RepID=A0AAD5RXP6_9PEZI|nr:hypothetical protein MKZ38_005342 [Zalerion maritima]
MLEKEKFITRRLLAEAHPPKAAQRIFSDKIDHRKLFLRPNSPPPDDARAIRRSAREVREQRKLKKPLKPKPLSARERRELKVYRVPPGSKKYATFAPLHNVWLAHIHSVLGDGLYNGGLAVAANLTSAEFLGAKVTVSRSSCPSRVGVGGIIIKDSKFVFELVTEKNAIKTIPKEGTVFKLEISPPVTEAPVEASKRDPLAVEIHGDKFQHRPADRSNKKFKTHFSTSL